MVCVLCFQATSDLISLNGELGRRLEIASILYKYFRFCFENEYIDGNICQCCWMKLDAFHIFYIEIEAIQTNKKQISDFVSVPSPAEDDKKFEDHWSDFDYGDTPFDGYKLDDDSIDEKPFQDNTTSNGITVKTEKVKKKPTKKSKPKKIKTENLAKIKKELGIEIKTEDQPSTGRGRPRKGFEKKRQEFQTIRCDICLEFFLNENKLERHKKTTHFVNAYRCGLYRCIESFETLELLEEHKELQHKTEKCPQCDKIILVACLSKHIKVSHETDQRVICHLCGKMLANKHQHKAHCKAEHEVNQRLQCDICKEWYKNRANLRSHMKGRHIEGPKTCDICGKISPNQKAMAKHRKVHQEGSKERFKCIVCGKGFRDRTKLKEHSYIHAGVTDAYECTFCGKAFRFGSSMYAHRKKMHPIEMAAMAAMASEGVDVKLN